LQRISLLGCRADKYKAEASFSVNVHREFTWREARSSTKPHTSCCVRLSRNDPKMSILPLVPPLSTTYPSPNTWTVPTVTSSTNLGPMTTPFSAPPDCLQNLYDFQTPGLIPGDLYTYYTQGCAISSCCPSSTPYAEIYACKFSLKPCLSSNY
jgi:hypothetical protein